MKNGRKMVTNGHKLRQYKTHVHFPFLLYNTVYYVLYFYFYVQFCTSISTIVHNIAITTAGDSMHKFTYSTASVHVPTSNYRPSLSHICFSHLHIVVAH
jgi:hypothetical protein